VHIVPQVVFAQNKWQFLRFGILMIKIHFRLYAGRAITLFAHLLFFPLVRDHLCILIANLGQSAQRPLFPALFVECVEHFNIKLNNYQMPKIRAVSIG
jgi:hypothetical protein